MRSISSVAGRLLPFVLIAAGACATTTQGSGSPRSHDRPISRQAQTLLYWQQLQDSVLAQAIADQEGPRVSIRAQFTNVANSRRIETYFTARDDAYVLVGHLDANGHVSILFPESPRDDGFVRGGKSYRTREQFAGFESAYLWRRSFSYAYTNHSPARYDSYDGGTGFVFIVASWRPMRFDRLASDDRWAVFDLMEDQLDRDPRPMIEELADILAGDNREAYTVDYAKYYTTNPLGSSLALRSRYCNGFSPYGYGFSLFGFDPFAGFGLGYYGSGGFGFGAFPGRFGYSAFDPFGNGCIGNDYYAYRPRYGQWAAAPVPPPPSDPQTPRERPRPGPPRIERPQPPIGKPVDDAPAQRRINADAEPLRPHVDEYRKRGLIVTDDGSRAGERQQRTAPLAPTARPGIVDMIGRGRSDFGEVRGSDSRYDRPRNARERTDIRATQPPRSGGQARPRESYDGSPSTSPRNGDGSARPRPSDAHQPTGSGGTGSGTGGTSTPRMSAPSAPSAPSARVDPPSSSGSGGHPVKPSDP